MHSHIINYRWISDVSIIIAHPDLLLFAFQLISSLVFVMPLRMQIFQTYCHVSNQCILKANNKQSIAVLMVSSFFSKITTFDPHIVRLTRDNIRLILSLCAAYTRKKLLFFTRTCNLISRCMRKRQTQRIDRKKCIEECYSRTLNRCSILWQSYFGVRAHARPKLSTLPALTAYVFVFIVRITSILAFLLLLKVQLATNKTALEINEKGKKTDMKVDRKKSIFIECVWSKKRESSLSIEPRV